MSLSLDQAIKAEYVVLDVPADGIVATPQLAKKFAEAVNHRLSDGECESLETINKRLLTLRKFGQAKGGLPRLRREYNGRGSNN